jgi:hypothetical protein
MRCFSKAADTSSDCAAFDILGSAFRIAGAIHRWPPPWGCSGGPISHDAHSASANRHASALLPRQIVRLSVRSQVIERLVGTSSRMLASNSAGGSLPPAALPLGSGLFIGANVSHPDFNSREAVKIYALVSPLSFTQKQCSGSSGSSYLARCGRA